MNYDISTQDIGAIRGEDGWFRVPMGQGVYLKLTPAEWAAWEGTAVVPLTLSLTEQKARENGLTDDDIALFRGIRRGKMEQRQWQEPEVPA